MARVMKGGWGGGAAVAELPGRSSPLSIAALVLALVILGFLEVAAQSQLPLESLMLVPEVEAELFNPSGAR